MAKEIVLWAGLHKTGSTSIQLTCGANASRLRDAGVIYPVTHYNGRATANHSEMLSILFKQDTARFGPDRQYAVDDARAAILAQARRPLGAHLARTIAQAPGRVLLVAESVSVLHPPELRALRDWLDGFGCSWRIICHTRRLASWLDSVIAQRVTGPMRLTLAAAIREVQAAQGAMRPRLQALQQVFPELEVHSHEAAAAHPNGPVGFVFEQLGISQEGMLFRRANARRSAAAVRVMSVVNERFGRFDEAGRPHPAHFNEAAALRALRSLPGPAFELTRPEAAPVLPLLEQENAWMRERYGEHFADPVLALALTDAPVLLDAALVQALEACPPQVAGWVRSRVPFRPEYQFD